MTHEELAIALGIARETLEKHFERELSVVAHQRRLDVLDAMYSTAIGSKVTGVKPNVAAQKAFVAASIALSPTPSPHTPKVDAPAVEKQKGKKEQANDDAVTAQVGTEWADLLKPSTRPQ
jgi:transcription elongation factor